MGVRTEPIDKWVRAYLGDTAVVDSRAPLMFWEESFPVPGYAFARDDVRLDLPEPSGDRSRCPYKGAAEEYWSLPGVEGGENIAWSYAAPFPAVGKVAGMIAFYNELVDITLDGEPQERAVSIFSDPKQRPVS